MHLNRLLKTMLVAVTGAPLAEDGETRAHHEFLCQHGCDELQGYYFSRPVPAFEIEALLRNADATQPGHTE